MSNFLPLRQVNCAPNQNKLIFQKKSFNPKPRDMIFLPKPKFVAKITSLKVSAKVFFPLRQEKSNSHSKQKYYFLTFKRLNFCTRYN